MYILVIAAFFLIAFGSVAWRALALMRVPASAEASRPTVSADRYRPMLRLLSDEDLNFVSVDPALHRTLRSRRRELFRSYLRCLGRDYGYLLGGIRAAMAQSGVDRPDLARALAKNRTLFFLAMYKVEFRLVLHAAGVGKVDISGLVDVLEALRAQVNVLTAVPSAA